MQPGSRATGLFRRHSGRCPVNINPYAPEGTYDGYRWMECAHPGCDKRSTKYLVPADSVDYCDEHTVEVA